jgi:hypothetical protein
MAVKLDPNFPAYNNRCYQELRRGASPFAANGSLALGMARHQTQIRRGRSGDEDLAAAKAVDPDILAKLAGTGLVVTERVPTGAPVQER